jgi:hypothetical protein
LRRYGLGRDGRWRQRETRLELSFERFTFISRFEVRQRSLSAKANALDRGSRKWSVVDRSHHRCV